MAIQLNKTKEFLDRVLTHVPEAEREKFRSDYSKAQDEITSAVTTVNTRAEEQAVWWEKNKHLGDAKPAGEPNPIAAAANNDALLKEVDKRLGTLADNLSGQGLSLATVIPTIIAQHGVEFGEVLDGEKLAQDAIKAGMDLKTYYGQLVGPKRAEKAAAATAKGIADAEERGRLKGIAEAGNGHIPYPTAHAVPTTLSGLRTPAADAAVKPYSLEAAVATATEAMNKQ